MEVLVIDVGGSRVKFRSTAAADERRFESGPDLTADSLVQQVRDLSTDWRYDVVSLGYPGTVDSEGPRVEPGNLADGWIRFDFSAAFDTPVRVVNDAVLQALGAYDGGRMLFLGLGTGLGSALVTERVVVPMELGNLQYGSETLGERLGRRGLETHGQEEWLKTVSETIPHLRLALVADYVVLGGGNAGRVSSLPPHTRRGSSDDAFRGGVRLWEEFVEPHDRSPPPVWRVVV